MNPACPFLLNRFPKWQAYVITLFLVADVGVAMRTVIPRPRPQWIAQEGRLTVRASDRGGLEQLAARCAIVNREIAFVPLFRFHLTFRTVGQLDYSQVPAAAPRRCRDSLC